MTFEGSIGEIDLVQRLVELGREHFTGAIRFEHDGIIKIIYFKAGDVLSASTNDRKDAIDEILLRAGKVSKEHVKQALAKRQENETLGDALLNLGFITRKELTWARRVQVIGMIRSVRAWTDGNYAIVADYLPKREEGTLFPLPQIIVEFTVTEQDRPTFERAMDGGEIVFHKSALFDATFPALDLNEDAAEIVRHVDGTNSASAIAAASGAEAFNVFKLLEALRILGLIERSADAPTAALPEPEAMDLSIAPLEDFSFETAGVADASDVFSAEPPPVEAPAPTKPDVAFSKDAPTIPFALSLDSGSTASANSPAWGSPQAEIPAAISAADATGEKQWGFDEAQIEAAQRAHVPSAKPTAKPRPTLSQPMRKQKESRGGLLYGVILALLIAGLGFGAWMWWQARKTPPPAPVVTRRRPVITPAPIPPPGSETTAAGGAPPAAVTSSAAPPAGATATPPTATARSAAVPPPPKPVAVAKTDTVTSTASRLEQSASGSRVITNTPAASAVSNAGRSKYDDMAQQYAKNPDGNFTVQFELVCQAASLQKAITNGGSNVWFVPTSYRGQSCYRVFWGHFDTRAAAIAAVGRVPPALQGSTPVVVAVPKP